MIAFDWDGTAVESRRDHPTELADAMEQLLCAGVVLAVITGTNADNVSGQIAPLLTPAARRNLFLLVNRGSEVYAHDEAGERLLLWRRDATAEELAALDAVADGAAADLAAHGITSNVIRNRLNRRKLDVIPEPAWADPPKQRIGELLEAVQTRLAGYPGGLAAVIELTEQLCEQHGLPDARITTDVKHVEIGLTDKSDSIAFLMRRLAPSRGIEPREIMIAGDEFGSIAGFEGSDYRMVTRLATGAALVSVGAEPNGTPPGVVHLGGGPAEFVRLLQRELARTDSRAERPAPPPVLHAAAEEAGDGWVVEIEGYAPEDEASKESRMAVGNGYLGIRGSVDEGSPGSSPAVFIAGLYDGPEAGIENLVCAPDLAEVRLRFDGVPVAPWLWHEPDDRRRIDLRALRLERQLRLTDPSGRTWLLHGERFASLARPHLAAFRLRLTLESGDPCRAGLGAPPPGEPLPRAEVEASGEYGGVDMLHARTAGARVAIDAGQHLSASVDGTAVAAEHVGEAEFSGRRVQVELGPGQTLTVDRIVAVFTERDQAAPAPEAARAAAESGELGYEAMLAEHQAAWARIWERAAVEIDGDHEIQLGVRFAIAQLVAAAPVAGARSSMAAKGLTGP